MTRGTNTHSELRDGRDPQAPDLITGEMQPGPARGTGRTIEANLGVQEKGGSDPEKSTHTDDNAQAGVLGTAASKSASKPEETATIPASNNAFGDDDEEYISGYKLYVALFSIVSVFFLVLLDFSITAT
ncbi:hypothetical protein diail_1034, partial [Diaporthe ilicicola]